MAALCQVGPEWFGILYSWADSKKKSNLMLTLLEPGSNPVPWLGDLAQLGVPADLEHLSRSIILLHFLYYFENGGVYHSYKISYTLTLNAD